MLPGWRLNAIGTMPSDALGGQVARRLQQTGDCRDRLTHGIYSPTDPQQALGRLEQAFTLMQQAEPTLKKIKVASRTGQLPAGKSSELVELAYEAGLISAAEAALVRETELVRHDAIQVDAFSIETYQQGEPLIVGLSQNQEEGGWRDQDVSDALNISVSTIERV